MTSNTQENIFATVPDEQGRYGVYGGKYVSETLMAALAELESVYRTLSVDPDFQRQLDKDLTHYVGRPSPLYEASRWSDDIGGARIFLKREDLNHTGAHKINNTIGQALLAKHMGKKRVIAETGAGQHGVATATIAACLGLECLVFMGEEDIRRQALNVFRMELLGATVHSVNSGSRTLKDATNEAMRDWMGSVGETHYILGSVVGPHPFPTIVRDFQSIIGTECRQQSLEVIGRLPELVVACVGGGSNAAGIFHAFVDDREVRLHGIEAGGRGSGNGDHAAPLEHGEPGVLHGSMSYVLQDTWGQTMSVHSCSAGLDYPGVGPEHASWKDTGRVTYSSVEDAEALEAFEQFSRLEGIIPALETAHAVAGAITLAGAMKPEENVVINVSGRGDKDVNEVIRLLGQDPED